MALTVYKYLDLRWATALVDEGRVLFSSLAWFQGFEDTERGDEFEGVRKYFPASGLDVTRVSEPAGPVVLHNHSFQSAARERDYIFIFCVSKRLSPELAAKFRGPEQKEMACVEIHNDRFFDRLAETLRKHSPVQRRTLFRDDVTYYSFEDPPGAVWALPAKLATHKDQSRFSGQEEYRFVFSTKRHAFAANRVETFLVGPVSTRPRPELNRAQHCRELVLGPLRECCRLMPM